ncbi:polymorphic toxin type 28 domain-containing protein [Glycomyces terrestris]|uniref:Bacterial toxin 28 domain-containing protein n=1 Tax=Glycomyces terrestris TaxID=2493553 RepID=A0A426UZ31_9ACTN|nr:polymorphic toxin type 28 domain-containing protein [Glycomyces terrestris]RRR99838.1 hypothetical protein EIW28_12010 [Glycomyces terrestris]
MRQALRLLLLLGAGFLLARKGGDGPDSPDGNGGDIDPLTGRPKDSEERQERLNFQGKNASSQMAEVHDIAETEAETGRADGSQSSGDSTSPDDTDTSTTTERDPDLDRLENRIDNVKEHLQYKDLDAARRELNGEIVATKSDGTPWDHVHEVRDAQNALMNIINKAKRKLDDPRTSDEDKAAYQDLLSQASNMLDYSEGFVPRS